MVTAEAKKMMWYTVKVQNSREKSISERIKLDMKRDYNEDINVLIPTQNVLVVKDGKRQEKVSLLYPGYIFVETSSVEKLNHVVKANRSIGATNIIIDKKTNKPQQLRQSEIDRMVGIKEAPATMKNLFQIGEKVMILEGAFQNFKGSISQIDMNKERVTVEVLIFGRKNMVDLAITDVIKHD